MNKLLKYTYFLIIAVIAIFALKNEAYAEDGTYIYGNSTYTYSQKSGQVTIINYQGSDSSITIPEYIYGQKVVKIDKNAFSNSNNLVSVVISKGVTEIGECAFINCKNLNKITLPSGLKTIGTGAFGECISLQEITVPSTVTSIGDWAFSECKALSKVAINSKITVIEDGTFYRCGNLKSITIPDSVTKIGDGAFFECKYIESLNIGGNVVSLGLNSLRGLDNLKSLTITGNTKDVDSSGIGCLSSGGISRVLTIYGAKFSATERYAYCNGINFLNTLHDCFCTDGTYTYYLMTNGEPMKNRLTYHPYGVHVIYFDENGHEVFDDFKHVLKSISGQSVDDYCYFNTFGYMYVDRQTYDKEGKHLYYINKYGQMEHTGLFRYSDGNIGYATPSGDLIRGRFYTYNKNMYYFHSSGYAATGLITDGVYYYNYDKNGKYLGRFK